MSKPFETSQKALTTRTQAKPYEVGYGKPPEETRFKPGQSGNPRGRPRGAKNKKPALNEERLKTIILEEAYRTIKVNDGPNQVTIPMAQAVVRSLAHNAVKGNTRAQRLFAEMLASTEAANAKVMQELFESAVEYKQNWNAELKRREQLGIDAPPPIPHPDHVVINVRNGTVNFKGPMTEEEKQTWDMMIQKRNECYEDIEEYQKDIAASDSEEYKVFLEDEIRHTQRIIEIIESKIGKDE